MPYSLPRSLPSLDPLSSRKRPPLLKSRLGLASHLCLVVMYKTSCRNLLWWSCFTKSKLSFTLSPRGWHPASALRHTQKEEEDGKKKKGHPRVSCACKIEREREISHEIAVAVALWWRKTHA